MFKSIVALCIFTIISSAAHAAPKVTESWHYYNVSGKTPSAIKSSMNANGPNGYWAHAKWYIRWDGDCNVKVKLTYRFPRLKNRAKVPAKVLKKWDAMLVHLKAHEKQHTQHGINAGNAIVKDQCRNGDAIIRKWAKQDKVLDKKTDHGKKTGVVFE